MKTLDQIRERLLECPANEWLGLQPVGVSQESIEFEIPVRPEMAGNRTVGAMHGGMVAALVDTICSFVWLAQYDGRVATIDLRTDFHKPIVVDRIVGIGRMVRDGRRIVTADAEIRDMNGELLASGRAVMKPYPV